MSRGLFVFFSFIPLKVAIILYLNFVSDVLFMFCLEEKKSQVEFQHPEQRAHFNILIILQTELHLPQIPAYVL